MADNYDAMFDKHFSEAGIEPDPVITIENKTDDKKEEKDTGDALDGSITKSIGDEAQTEKAEETKQGEQPAGDAGNKQGGAGDSQQQQEQKPKEQSAANPNDLTLADGTVVKAGAERRWYENARIARQENGNLKNEINTWKQKATEHETKYNAMVEAARQVGNADPVQMQDAMRLYNDLRRDPVNTLKQLLVDVKGLGHNVDMLGPSVDTQAILAEIDRRLPIKASVEPNVEQINDAAKQEVEQFFSQNEDARLHDAYIAAVMEAHPNASLAEAYLALKTQALEQGFDWSKDLGPQVEAAKARQAQQGQQQQQQQQAQPPINGGKPLQNAVEYDPAKKKVQAESFEDAIRAGMRDAGININ